MQPYITEASGTLGADLMDVDLNPLRQRLIEELFPFAGSLTPVGTG
jgi:hypothetical protein